MSITAIARDWGIDPCIVRIVSTATLAQVGTAGYLTAQAANIASVNSGAFEWTATDFVLVSASDGWDFFSISSDFTSLDVWEPGAGVAVVGAPVVVGNFAVFQSTSGNIEDLGYMPSDASKTSVVMAGSAVIVGRIAHFVDTAGTIDDTAGAVTNAGNISAGLSGTAGTFTSFPAIAANGTFVFAAVGNAGNFNVTVSPVSTQGQSTVMTIPDAGNAVGRFLIGATATPFTTGHLLQSSGTGGLVSDSAIATANVVVNNAPNTFSGTGSIILPKVNGTEAANAVTASGVAGVITTSALTTAGGGTYVITWTNTAITTTSVIGLTIQGGTNTTQNINFKVVPGAGSATLTIFNLTAATALNGTVLIGYTVF